MATCRESQTVSVGGWGGLGRRQRGAEFRLEVGQLLGRHRPAALVQIAKDVMLPCPVALTDARELDGRHERMWTVGEVVGIGVLGGELPPPAGRSHRVAGQYRAAGRGRERERLHAA
jgi:hypothetical protein